jgi:PPM family protein phosphatase
MIRTTHSHLHIAAVTHPGTAGKLNEDRLAVSAYQVSENNATRSVFAIVSDGIGGHRAGEVAAEMAVENISHMVAQSDAVRPVEILDNAIQVTSEAIASRGKDNTQRLGMGTTCVCAWIIGDQLFTASVGDSRIYLLSQSGLMQLTVDHTWVQEAVERGILDPKDMRNHPNVHVIRRYLGSTQTPQADIRLRLARNESDTQSRSNQGLRLHAGDLLLLCTDGLTDVVDDAEIAITIRGLDLQSAAHALVNLACTRNARDNITVVMMLVPPGPLLANQPLPVIRKERKYLKWLLWGLVGLILLTLVIAGLIGLLSHFFQPLISIPTP